MSFPLSPPASAAAGLASSEAAAASLPAVLSCSPGEGWRQVQVQVQGQAQGQVQVQERVQVQHLLCPDLGDVDCPGSEDHPGRGPARRRAVSRRALVLDKGGSNQWVFFMDDF